MRGRWTIVRGALVCVLAVVCAGCANSHAGPSTAPQAAPEAVSFQPFPPCTEGPSSPYVDDFRGVTIVPMVGARRDAELAAEIVRDGFVLPVRVLPERPIPPTACRGAEQVVLERLMEAAHGSTLPRRTIIVVTAHDLRSDTYPWQFGGWWPERNLGVISTARLTDHRGVESGARATRRRLTTLVNKYVLVLYFDAATRPADDSSSLLGPKYSFEQLDVAQRDPCEYRSEVVTDAALLRCS